MRTDNHPIDHEVVHIIIDVANFNLILALTVIILLAILSCCCVSRCVRIPREGERPTSFLDQPLRELFSPYPKSE